MLNEILYEIENSKGAFNLNDLSRKLEIDRSALDGMIQMLVHKGRLVDADAVEMGAGGSCSTGSCGTSCSGPDECSFIAKMPKSYTVSIPRYRDGG